MEIQQEEGVCKLKKIIYVPSAWFKPFTKSLKKYGFSENQGDCKLYFKCTPFMKMNILIVYVDNIIVAVYNFKEIPSLKTHLTEEFEIKGLGTLRYFLSMEEARTKHCMTVCKESMYLIS